MSMDEILPYVELSDLPIPMRHLVEQVYMFILKIEVFLILYK